MKALPNSISKRDLLHGAKVLDSATYLAHGQRYVAAEQYSDAVDFFSKAGAEDELKKLAAKMIEEGDSFLLLKIMHFAHGLVSDSDVERCAENAEKFGKIRYAILGYQKLDNEEKVEELKASISEDGDIVAEQEAETFLAPNLEEIQELDEDD